MIKTTIFATISMALSGCAAVPVAAVYSGSLKGVERVAAIYLVETQPALPLQASVICMTNAMSQVEVIRLGSKDNRYLTKSYRSVFEEIEDRPKAANCLAALGETTA
jgi:hypothetical protein